MAKVDKTVANGFKFFMSKIGNLLKNRKEPTKPSLKVQKERKFAIYFGKEQKYTRKLTLYAVKYDDGFWLTAFNGCDFVLNVFKPGGYDEYVGGGVGLKVDSFDGSLIKGRFLYFF